MTDFGARHKISHQDGGGDEIDVAGLAGRVDYVDRGDPPAADWTQAALTADGTWRDLDCSAIVPDGATVIHFRLVVADNETGWSADFRKKGNISAHNIASLYTFVANLPISVDMFIACSTLRQIQYRLSATAWDYIRLTIAGWYI